MNEGPSGGPSSIPSFAIAVALVVLLAGCVGSFGPTEEIDPYSTNGTATGTAAPVTTAPPTAAAEATVPDSTSTPGETESSLSQRETTATPTPRATPTATPSSSEDDSEPVDDSEPIEGNDGGSSGASSGSSGAAGSSSGGSSGSSGESSRSDASAPTTTATPTTVAPITAPPSTTAASTTATAATTTTASSTDAPERADACEAYEVREGPRANTELESDDSICITEWDDRPFIDTYTVTGVVGNPSGETIDHVDVEVTLYDGDGNVLASKTDGIDDLGETDRFVVEFTELFEGENALEPDSDIASYRIDATVGQSPAPGTTTTETTPAETATATESPVPTTASVPTETTTTAASTTAEPTPTEPDGGVEGSVESDENTAVTSHEIDTSGGEVVVTGTLTNPTDARMGDPSIGVTLYDDEGEVIQNDEGETIGHVGASFSEEPPISPLLEPGEDGSFEARFPNVDPDEVASYTVRSSAIDPAEDPANTPADFAVTFDRMSWQDAPLETYLEVTNQKEETVERLDVVITAYDENGTVIAEHTEPITDLGIGETVTFDHVFEVTDNEVDRVEVHLPGEDYGFVN